MCTKNRSTGVEACETAEDVQIIRQNVVERDVAATAVAAAAAAVTKNGGGRVRDRNRFRHRAASFCARLAPAESGGVVLANNQQNGWPPKLAAMEVLMVSGRTAGDWVLPGGGVENLESTEEAVVRELREEAGILGRVLFYIGEFIDDQRFHHTTMYFLTVVEMFTEWGENCEHGRQRRWMRMEEARHNIKANQLEMLEGSIKIIERTLDQHQHLHTTVRSSLMAAPIISPGDDQSRSIDTDHRSIDNRKGASSSSSSSDATEAGVNGTAGQPLNI